MADASEGLLIGKGTAAAGPFDVHLLPQMANRHGLVAGATGTGKTVTLQVLAEAFSSIGVPVFAADIKGDLSGVSQPGGGNAKVDERVDAARPRRPGTSHGSPVMFWDVFGEQGHPVRTTVSEVGPAAPLPHAQPERHPGGRAHRRVPRGRRQRPAAARHGRPARDAQVRGRQRGRDRHDLRQRRRGLDRRHPARAAQRSRSRAGDGSSASPPSTSSTSCRPTPTARATSTSSRPTSS